MERVSDWRVMRSFTQHAKNLMRNQVTDEMMQTCTAGAGLSLWTLVYAKVIAILNIKYQVTQS